MTHLLSQSAGEGAAGYGSSCLLHCLYMRLTRVQHPPLFPWLWLLAARFDLLIARYSG